MRFQAGSQSDSKPNKTENINADIKKIKPNIKNINFILDILGTIFILTYEIDKLTGGIRKMEPTMLLKNR